MARLLLLALGLVACGATTPLFPRDASVPDAGLAADGGAADGGHPDGGAGDGGQPEEDGGEVAVDPVCKPDAGVVQNMTFYLETAVIAQDVVLVGPVLEVDREKVVIGGEDGGARTVHWTLPALARPPLRVGDRIELLYRPYNLGTLQAASVLVRAAEGGRVLFVGDTGLHRTRISQSELEVATIGVQDRGCSPFGGCGDARVLDLVLTDEAGGSQRVELGQMAPFTYRGLRYEVVHVYMAELPYIRCNVIPARYRMYVVQHAPE